ncbi:MAG TPA: MEMO1 family protein [Methanothrix sp.]|nr:MEMO1 family protein [Methanothrix sp.]
MRNPAVAGQFYPASAAELMHQLDEMLHSAAAEEVEALGAVVPHAGYVYSGAVAAEVYSCLPKRDTYVILGPNHHGLGAAVALSRDSWRTPLGTVETDIELADALAGSIIDHDELAHRHEHSIEVQIPFLQARFQGFRVLPIAMGLQDEETAVEVGEEVAKAALKLKRSCTVIASSDFTHYERQEVARKVDSQLIEAILNMDVPELYARVYNYNATACGYGPIAAAMTAAAALAAATGKAASGKLLRYATSGDVTGSFSQVVGYGAIVFT